MRFFSDYISIFFCTLPEADFVNNYESYIQWITIDIILRDCFIFKKLICKTFYSKANYRTSADFITVKEYLTSCKEEIRNDKYGKEDFEVSDSEDERNDFDQEYFKMPEAAKIFNKDFLDMEQNEHKFNYYVDEINEKIVIIIIFLNSFN